MDKNEAIEISKIEFEIGNSSKVNSTSEIIHEKYRQKDLEGKLRTKIVILVSIFVAISAVIPIGLMQYDQYFAYLNKRYDYINRTRSFCDNVFLANIDVVSTPISVLLIILYVLLYKRRVFLRDRFKYRNFGCPFIGSCWNKTDRLFSSFTYGLIAYNVYCIVRNTLNNTSRIKLPFSDYTGIVPLLIQVGEMFLIGVRYYPVLVAFRANSFLINITSCIYMWIDFVENAYQLGRCDNFETYISSAETRRRFAYFLVYKVLSAIPLSIFSSFIVITLTYKSVVNLIDFTLSWKSQLTRSRLIDKSKDSWGCLLMNVNDDNELIYSKFDLDYVLDLLNNRSEKKSLKNDANRKNHKKLNDKYIIVEPNTEKSKIRILFETYIYDWDPYFRFTSRFCNTLTVGLVSLYYFFVYWTYKTFIKTTYFVSTLPDVSVSGTWHVNIGDALCGISEQTCIPGLRHAGAIPIPLPNRTIRFLPSLHAQLNVTFILPCFLALFICLGQIFFLLKDIRKHLRELYKGECEFVPKAKNLENESIASSSFHFGGYVVGYLMWGYFIIYFFAVMIGLAFIASQLFFEGTFTQTFLKMLPIISVIVIKRLVNTIATKHIFLYRNSKLLALENFRAFNVFLYFNFYFDCFMGFVSAVIRIIIAIIFAILMLPKSHQSRNQLFFSGKTFGKNRQWLFMLHGISTHGSNILYYKELGEHILRYKFSKKALIMQAADEFLFRLTKFNGRLSITGPQGLKAPVKIYNKIIVNRWHVMLRLNLNKELIQYRKEHCQNKTKNSKPR